jgi:hypothetical protein
MTELMREAALLFVTVRRLGIFHTAKTLFGNGIITAAAKRIATQNTPRAQNDGGKNVSFTESRQRIFGA